jgi:YD repeat-containing protein
MNEKWLQLPFDSRLQMVRDMAAADIKATYQLTTEEYRRAQEMLEELPKVMPRMKLQTVNAAPDKRSLREASRDFTLTLTTAELIDNAIDRFLKEEPTEKDILEIDISFDKVMNACIYEDNAGGFRKEDLPNFFKPGGTDNQSMGWSIGSYAWGAKKARSALADAVELISRTSSGPACFASIDGDWDNRDEDWSIKVGEEGVNIEGPKTKIRKGHTRIIFKNLKPLVDISTGALEVLRRNLGELYALLLAHHSHCPYKFQLAIKIDGHPVTGDYAYKWTQYRDEAVDVHPRQYFLDAEVTLPFVTDPSSKTQKVEFILEIGVKQDTGGATESIRESDFFDTADDWGIDVYGLGIRLIDRNIRAPLGLRQELVKREAGAKLVKGRLIILGSSYAIPWDTHKANVAIGHPTLLAINEKIGPYIQSYVNVAQKAARRLQKAVNKFTEAAWDGGWERTEPGGTKMSFSYDYRGQLTAETDSTGEPETDGEEDAEIQEAEVSTAEAQPPSTNSGTPASPAAGGGRGAETQAGAPSSTAASETPPRPPAGNAQHASPLPSIQTSRSNGAAARQKQVKFSVSDQEHQTLCKWLKCDKKELNDKLKKRVLKEAKAKSAGGNGGGVDTKAFEKLRAKINSPAILSRLQAAGLTTLSAVRKAGKSGLTAAGLSGDQADQVLRSLN